MAMRGFDFARKCFTADSIVVAKCDCGGNHITLYLLDKEDRIHAVAQTEPGMLERLAREAVVAEPAHVRRPN